MLTHSVLKERSHAVHRGNLGSSLHGSEGEQESSSRDGWRIAGQSRVSI